MLKYKNNIHTNAFTGLVNGVDQAVSVVEKTMGARGTNVALQYEQYPYHEITNDGATIIEKMYFEDPIENMGLQFLKEVVGRSNKNAGDGSTTTSVLVKSLLKQGQELGKNGIVLKKSLDECIPIVEQAFDKIKKNIISNEQVKQIATVSSEDVKLGSLLAEVYEKIGSDGIIQPEYILGKETDTYSFIQGVRFSNQCGLLSPSMVHDEEAIKENRRENRAVYESPLILVTKRKIANLKEIDPIIKVAQRKEKDLVIFADDMDSQVAQVLIANHQLRKSGVRLDIPRITIIKAPVVWKEYVYEDFSKCVGATVVCDPTGITFKNIKEEHLGTCDKIIIERDETVIIGTQDLNEHIQELQAQVDSGNDFHDDALRRIGWLTSKTVLLKIGGLSETELTYKRLKCEDAINATRSALTHGFVAGGGVAYLDIIPYLPETIGGTVLKKALEMPLRQIMINANAYQDDISQFGNGIGFDAYTGEKVDMITSGIIDSAKISMHAVKNAIGIVSTILTVKDAITLPPKKEQPTQQMMMPPMGMM